MDINYSLAQYGARTNDAPNCCQLWPAEQGQPTDWVGLEESDDVPWDHGCPVISRRVSADMLRSADRHIRRRLACSISRLRSLCPVATIKIKLLYS